MKSVYRIIKHTFYENCELKLQYFTVQYETKFLWWKMWKTLKRLECSGEDCHQVVIQYDSQSDAINAIDKLYKGNIIDGWTEEVLYVFNFDDM